MAQYTVKEIKTEDQLMALITLFNRSMKWLEHEQCNGHYTYMKLVDPFRPFKHIRVGFHYHGGKRPINNLELQYYYESIRHDLSYIFTVSEKNKALRDRFERDLIQLHKIGAEAYEKGASIL